MSPGNVLILGGVSWNTMVYLEQFPAPEPATLFARSHYETLGSTGAGKALNLAPLGVSVTLQGRLSDDAAGAHIERYLSRFSQRPGIDLTFLRVADPQPTQRHLNLMNSSGERISIFLEAGSQDLEVDWQLVEPHIAAADVVALNIINYCRQAIPLIRRQHRPIWVDLHSYDGQGQYHDDFIEAADVLFLSTLDLPHWRAWAEAQIAHGKQLVVCTHGARGADALASDHGWLHVPALPAANIVDTNGAGDAFFSGVLYGHLAGRPLQEALRLGALAAALCLQTRELGYPDLTPGLLATLYERYYGDA